MFKTREFKSFEYNPNHEYIYILYSLAGYNNGNNHIQMLSMSTSYANLVLVSNDIIDELNNDEWHSSVDFKDILKKNMFIDKIKLNEQNPLHTKKALRTIKSDELEKLTYIEQPKIKLYYILDNDYSNADAILEKYRDEYASCDTLIDDDTTLYKKTRVRLSEQIFIMENEKKPNLIFNDVISTIRGLIDSVFTSEIQNNNGSIMNDDISDSYEVLSNYNPLPLRIEIHRDVDIGVSLHRDRNYMPNIIEKLLMENDNKSFLKMLKDIVETGYTVEYLIDYIDILTYIAIKHNGKIFYECQNKEKQTKTTGWNDTNFIKNNLIQYRNFLDSFYTIYPLEKLVTLVSLDRLINKPYRQDGKNMLITIRVLNEIGKISLNKLLEDGFTMAQIIGVRPVWGSPYSVESMNRWTFTINELVKEIPLKILLKNGITVELLEKAGINNIPLKDIGLTPSQLRKAGVPLKDLLQANFAIKDLNDVISSEDLTDGSISPLDLFNAGFSIKTLSSYYDIDLKQLIKSGIPITELVKAGVSLKNLIKESVSISELIKAGISLNDLLYYRVSISELIKAGVSIKDLIKESVSISELVKSGISISELVNAGVSIIELAEEGFTALELHNQKVSLKNIFATGLYTYGDIQKIYKTQPSDPELKQIIEKCSKNLLRKTNLVCKYNPSTGGVIETSKVYKSK